MAAQLSLFNAVTSTSSQRQSGGRAAPSASLLRALLAQHFCSYASANISSGATTIRIFPPPVATEEFVLGSEDTNPLQRSRNFQEGEQKKKKIAV